MFCFVVIPLATAMQVETDDFILSLTSDDVHGDGQTEVVTTVSDLPADLVNTDVSDLVGIIFRPSSKIF